MSGAASRPDGVAVRVGAVDLTRSTSSTSGDGPLVPVVREAARHLHMPSAPPQSWFPLLGGASVLLLLVTLIVVFGAVVDVAPQDPPAPSTSVPPP